MSYIAIDTTSFRYLSHYGIKGQKWGIRRFQNPDGTLTSEGRKRAKAEYKEDNKQAFENGKLATIGDRAYGYAVKGKQRADTKFAKKQTERTKKRKEIADRTEQILKEEKVHYDKKARDHYNELVKKYGKEAISNINIDKKGRYNERIHTGMDYVMSLSNTMAFGMAASMLGLPVAPVFYPASKNQVARTAYDMAKLKAKKEYKNSHS